MKLNRMTGPTYTLSDFCNMEIIRHEDGVAEIIWFQCPEGPVRLPGFEGDASQSDYDIREDGYHYYLELMEELKKQDV